MIVSSPSQEKLQPSRILPKRSIFTSGTPRPRPRGRAWLAIYALVISAILVGSLLRFANLNDIPPGLNQDEAVNGYDAYSLFVTGRDHHGHPFPFAGLESFGDWVSPLLTFLTVPVVGLWGLHVQVVRGVAAAIGVLAIPIIYRLGVELFGNQSIGVAAAWFIALDPWAVDRSRFANPSAIVPTMVALLMLALIWTVRHRSERGVIALAIAAGLTIASYPTMKLYVPLLLLAAFLIYGRRFLELKREVFLYAAVILILIAGPILYLSLADPGGRARLEQVSVFNSGNASALFLAQQYKSYFSPWVFFVAGNGHPGQSATPPGAGVELVSVLPFILAGIVGLGMMIMRPSQLGNRCASLFLFAALLLYPVPATLTIPTPPLPSPHLSRGIQIIPLLALVYAVGAVALFSIVMYGLRNAPVQVRRLALAFLVVLALVATGVELAGRYRDYFTEYARRETVLDYFQYGMDQVVAYARAHEGEYDQVWITDVNQPYIYLLFYSKWSPSDVHEHLEVRRAPPEFNQVTALGKYHFGEPPNVTPQSLALLYKIKDSNGRTVYEVRGGKMPDGTRTLLAQTPKTE